MNINCFYYGGYFVLMAGLRLFLIVGPGFRGYVASLCAAMEAIDGVINGVCEY